MKRPVHLFMLIALLLCLPAAMGARGEADDWRQARRRDDVKGHDAYLALHPEGAHAREARQRAIRKSAEELGKTAKTCGRVYPRMVYYVAAAGEDLAVSEDVIASSLSDASDCTFSRFMSYQDLARSTDGLLSARSRLVVIPETRFPARAVIDLDFILYDLEDKSINQAFAKIIKCSDQSAWVDTSAKAAFACARPHRELQARYAEAMSEQAKSDFERIGRVNDDDYRLGFWRKFQKLARSEVIKEVAVAYQLHSEALRAKPRERNPLIQAEIETTAIKLGGGKPTGAPY